MRSPAAQQEKIRIANDLAQKVASVFRVDFSQTLMEELVLDLSEVDLQVAQNKKAVILRFLIKHDGLGRNIFELLTFISDRLCADLGPAFCQFYLRKWELSGKAPKFWTLKSFQDIALSLRIILFQLALAEKLLSRADIFEWLRACSSREWQQYSEDSDLLDLLMTFLFSEKSELCCLAMAVVEALPAFVLQKIVEEWIKKDVLVLESMGDAYPEHKPLAIVLNLPEISAELIAKLRQAYPGVLEREIAQHRLEGFIAKYMSCRKNFNVFRVLLSFADEPELLILRQAFPDCVAHQESFDLAQSVLNNNLACLDHVYQHADAVFEILMGRLEKALREKDRVMIEKFSSASTDIGDKTALSYFLHNYSREGTWSRSWQLLSESALGLFPDANRCKLVRAMLLRMQDSAPAVAAEFPAPR